MDINQLSSNRPPEKGAQSSAQKVLRTFVGKLSSQWTFPSDHIPVGGTIGGVKIASWNLLNRAYMGFFSPDGADEQGLAESCLVPEQSKKSGIYWQLSVREERIAAMIIKLLASRDIIFLQECGPAVVSTIKELLPKESIFVTGSATGAENDIAVIYNQAKVTVDPADILSSADGFRCKKGRAIMSLRVKHQGKILHFLHSHVPGMPSKEGLVEFADQVKARCLTTEPIIIVGDLNFELPEISDMFHQAGLPPPRSAVEARSTVGADRFAKLIDHVLILNPAEDLPVILESPSSILPDCNGASKLLRNAE